MEAIRHAGPVEGVPGDEAALVARVKADPAVFGEVYRRHYRAVAACLYRRTGDVHASEDLAAETFIAAYRAIRRFRPGTVPLRHWLLKIATNGASRWARRGRRGVWVLAAVGQERRGPALDAEDGAPAGAARLRECVARLGAAHQAVVGLHYFEGLSVEEVGAALEISEGTVKSRLARARARLKEMLGERS